MKKRWIITLLLAIAAVTPAPAMAHYPWITLTQYKLEPGDKIKAFIGSGHQFPVEDLLKAEEIAAVTIYTPDGKKINAPAINEFQFEGPTQDQPGAYLVTAEKKPGFYTKLAKGFARESKKGLKDVQSCTHSMSFMKAIVNIGQGGGKVDRIVGHYLEMIPMKNPTDLKVGDTLPIRVLFQGNPVEGNPQVLATYAGFPNSRAYAHASTAGKDGMTNLRILHPGLWLVYINIKMPYPDTNECDQTSYTSVLTFKVD